MWHGKKSVVCVAQCVAALIPVHWWFTSLLHQYRGKTRQKNWTSLSDEGLIRTSMVSNVGLSCEVIYTQNWMSVRCEYTAWTTEWCWLLLIDVTQVLVHCVIVTCTCTMRIVWQVLRHSVYLVQKFLSKRWMCSRFWTPQVLLMGLQMRVRCNYFMCV